MKKDISSTSASVELSNENNKSNVDIKIKSFVDENEYKTQEETSETKSVETSENNTPSNEELENIQVDYKAYLGNDEIKDGDTVHNGEYIKYVATIKNNSNEKIDNVTFVGQVPDNAVYVEIKDEELTKEEIQIQEHDECKITEKKEIKEYTEIISLNEKEEKTISFYVKVNGGLLENSNITSSVKLRKNENEKNCAEINNISKKSNLSIELKGWETERGKNIWLFMATFTNNTNTEHTVNTEADSEKRWEQSMRSYKKYKLESNIKKEYKRLKKRMKYPMHYARYIIANIGFFVMIICTTGLLNASESDISGHSYVVGALLIASIISIIITICNISYIGEY